MTTVIQPDPAPVEMPASPWHAGERLLQEHVGVAARMAQIGPKVLRDYMPDQHRDFYAQLPLLLAGAVDPAGDPWAGALEGEPGFAWSPDPRVLRVAAMPDADDPLAAGLGPGKALGLLGIELQTRRRNRVNGLVSAWDGRRFEVTVGRPSATVRSTSRRANGIFARARPALRRRRAGIGGLDAAAAALIRRSDTFFVASYADTPEGGRQVDISHRGGRPGFVRVDGDVLTIPDFSGNRYFNTLGNLAANPRAGLLFIDFERGDTLQLSGPTELVLEGPEVASFEGAERLWRVRARRAVRRPGALALRWRFGDYAPTSLATGQWPAAL